ncbi:DUF6456 domain-containing protein [Marivivens aquimaris]|uniref:DUF6456 domain-containing protein n=1 Tax=Marivivens aquimaris TaxID=2774876 RepID=UPI00187F5F57|nr:DUF6456 domain-containing protein [Marivivens aquimaris]
METAESLAFAETLPKWLPEAARNYLMHTARGVSIRALARAKDCHASTILRQVRRYENLRDDPLVDDALHALSNCGAPRNCLTSKDFSMQLEPNTMTTVQPALIDETRIREEGGRILRRLCEAGAVLAVAREMEMAVVVRDTGGETTRTAVTPREIAQAMALRDWVACEDPSARIARYRITSAGRQAVKEMLGAPQTEAGFVRENAVWDDEPTRRAVTAESPLTMLARRRDKDGSMFLPREYVVAGERLREDFELGGMSAFTVAHWHSFLMGQDVDTGAASAAKERALAALVELGPGLGDVVVRCCCYLEGLETIEKELLWAARSGKIVLRIALERLRRHYDRMQHSDLIG